MAWKTVIVTIIEILGCYLTTIL